MHSPTPQQSNALPNHPRSGHPGQPGMLMASPQLAAVHASPTPTPETPGPVHIKVRWVRVIAALALVGIGGLLPHANLTANTPAPQESSKQIPADRAVAGQSR